MGGRNGSPLPCKKPCYTKRAFENWAMVHIVVSKPPGYRYYICQSPGCLEMRSSMQLLILHVEKEHGKKLVLQLPTGRHSSKEYISLAEYPPGKDVSNIQRESFTFPFLNGLKSSPCLDVPDARGDGEAKVEKAEEVREATEKSAEAVEEVREDTEYFIPSNLECACCFSDFGSDGLMIQCSDACVFCKECVRQLIAPVLGGLKSTGFDDPKCFNPMKPSCSGKIIFSQLERALDPDTLRIYEKRKADENLVAAAAKDGGIVKCPFCYSYYWIESPMDHMFCTSKACGKVSCFKCKKEHFPHSCPEKEAETSATHAVEEEMSAAVIQKCPVCSKPIMQEGGCNKMKCSHCSTIFCYLCRKTGVLYSHYCKDPVGYRGDWCRNRQCKKCHLFGKRDEDKIAEAAKEKAIQDLELRNPGLRNQNIGPPPPKKQRVVVDDEDL